MGIFLSIVQSPTFLVTASEPWAITEPRRKPHLQAPQLIELSPTCS
jgi:hypothetical protein